MKRAQAEDEALYTTISSYAAVATLVKLVAPEKVPMISISDVKSLSRSHTRRDLIGAVKLKILLSDHVVVDSSGIHFNPPTNLAKVKKSQKPERKKF